MVGPRSFLSGLWTKGQRSVGGEEVEKQQRVEEAAALLVETLDDLRRRPSDQMGPAAREALLDLRPHVEAALETLETVEERRALTDRERDLRHAFKMLLAAR
jgi:hypothetical protein